MRIKLLYGMDYKRILNQAVFFEREILVKEAAEYQGRKVKLNDPIRNPPGSKKKFRVYVKDPKTKKVRIVQFVQFGDPNMGIKGEKSPKSQKNFRARHNCDNPGPKTKARYWSCYQWRPGKKVDS